MSHRLHPITSLLLLVATLTACALPGGPAAPTATTALTPGPTATRGAGAATPTRAAASSPSPAATATRAAPAPSAPVLAVPREFANSKTAELGALQQAQPSLKIEKTADGAAAAARLDAGQATWAVVDTAQAAAGGSPLCVTAYVPIVHYTSEIEDITTQRLRAAYLGQDWPGPVLYSGDVATLRRLVGVDSLGSRVSALPSWKDVINRVAGDRSALAYVPWSEVDARVKALSLDGKSIAVDGMQGYGRGDGWWLTAGGDRFPGVYAAASKQLACAVKEPVTFLAAGDVLMGWFVNEIYIAKQGPEYPFQRIRDLFQSADIAFANFENPMSTRGVMENKGLMFRASPAAVKGLTYAGIDVVNLANNHLGDYGPQAVLDTLDTLRQNGIGYAGAGKNRAEARSPWITTTKGIKVAILAYNEIEPGYFAATDSKAGTAWIEPDNVANEIKQAKQQADFVIASFHWGIEYTAQPNDRQQQLARRAVEAGANLVVGHHPHVVQAAGFVGNVYVNYSIGDFVYSQPTRPATGEGIILRAVIDGKTLRQVQMIPIYIDRAQPYVISPVEAKLMMARIFDASREIKGMPPSTEQTLPPATAAPPPSAPVKERLAMVRLDGQRSDIVAVPLGSVAGAMLTTDGAVNDAPAFSPDGTRLAYATARNGNVDIYVAGADGKGAVNISHSPAWDDYPAWSPDGKQIAFSSNRGGPYQIYIMNADGSNVRRVTSGNYWDTTPAWSPDGARLAFASDRSGTFNIYTVNLDGAAVRALTNHSNLNAFPSWSPDGKLIVYQSYRDESAVQGDDSVQDRDYEIIVMGADGGNARRLTSNLFADIDPAWSPDGKRIAFASDRSGSLQIYTMNADGSDVRSVTGGPGSYTSPTWSP